jgi:DNA-binding GntR family transcriptional regulator
MRAPSTAPASRTDRVYGAITAAIFDGRLRAGTRLAEDRLGDIFGVSRTVVRAALHRLGHDGVVTLQPNRGACVAMPNVEEARDVFEARRSVEDTIVRRAAERLRPAQLRRLRSLLARERAAEAAGNRLEGTRLSGEFHLLLADLAGNQVLAGFLRELVARSSLILSLYGVRSDRQCAMDEHAALLDALASHDAEAGARVMCRHLRDIETSLDLATSTDNGPDLATLLG